jgi:hypothetical protein
MFMSHKRIGSLLLGFGLAAGFVGGLTHGDALAAPKAVERHPELHKAIHALQNSKLDLEHALHDYQGHRVAAIKAIDVAIQELQAALASDPG